MDKKKVIVNIFSNWTNFIISIVIAFFVSPIIVHNLGNENYGIWTLIVSITGYFTVLDFGVNTAIVRYISMYQAKKDYDKANEVYSSGFIFFLIIGVSIFILTAIFAFFFKDIFNIETLSRKYLYFVFFIVGSDLAIGFIFSVYMATLSGLQEFLKINIISISIVFIKNVLIVSLLLNGYDLMSLAMVQLFTSLLRVFLQHLSIKRNYNFLSYKREKCNKSTIKEIFSYSIYSFIIAIALKLLFFTDTVVIGKMLKVSEVTFYAIPAMIMEYIEKLIWTVTAVLIPVISSYDATGNQSKNQEIYIYGSMYSLLLSIPIVFVLYTKGSNFISLWMGEEYGLRAAGVLKILLIGYVFHFPQMISHGVLKGVSKHKVYAYILIVEALSNLGLSIFFVQSYGIEGVALGTAIPLVVANVVAIPVYTCYVLELNVVHYMMKSYVKPFLALVILFVFDRFFSVEVTSYVELINYIASVLLFMLVFSISTIEDTHRQWIVNGIKSKLYKTA